MLDQVLIIMGVTFLILIVPGPDMIIVMRNTMVGGRKTGYQTALGILTGNLVHITYCVVGIGWIISKSIVAFNIIKYAGAAYLVYLGISSLNAKETLLRIESTEPTQPNQRWFIQGFINNVLNPKGTLFFLGVFTTIITPETTVVTTVMLVSIIMVMCAIFWLFFVQTLDSAVVRNFFESSQTTLQKIFGAVFIGLGLRVALISR